MGNKHKNKDEIILKKEENISNFDLIYENKNKRCITSFALLRNNKIMLTFKGGIIIIYEFIKDKKKKEKFELKEIINLEREEYCFNYGIELKNGDLAICSEDSTINIIELLLDINNNKKTENKNNNENNDDNHKYKIKQLINLGNDPLYIIKEFINGELVVGSWNFIFIFNKIKNLDIYELITKIFIDDRTFSLIELNPGEILSSQCYSKQLTIHKIHDMESIIINNIESNENPNIICKYKNQNEIIFVASDKGINVVSVIHKCLIQIFNTKEIISSICPFISHLKNKIEIFTLLCGTKKRVFGRKVNFSYNLLQIFFKSKEKNKNEIVFDGNINNQINKITEYRMPEKESIHFYDIKQIENLFFCDNNIFDMKKEGQMIISIGCEDKSLKFWKFKK